MKKSKKHMNSISGSLQIQYSHFSPDMSTHLFFWGWQEELSELLGPEIHMPIAWICEKQPKSMVSIPNILNEWFMLLTVRCRLRGCHCFGTIDNMSIANRLCVPQRNIELR